MSEQAILAVFDGLAESFEFAGFNNENYESVDARMHLFRKDDAWAVLIEEAVYWIGSDGPQTILFGAGPLLANGEGGLITPFESRLVATEDGDGGVETATLGGEPIDLEPVLARAEELDLEPAYALVIYLSEKNRQNLFQSAEKMAAYVLPGATHILTVEEWNHPDVYRDEKPSASEAFQQVAKVLASGDVSAFAPKAKPNSRDWKMWEDSK